MSGGRETLMDEQILEILHLHEVEGLTASEIAPRFRKTKNAIVGLIYRTRTETDLTDNGHGNGTMPPRWWAKRRART